MMLLVAGLLVTPDPARAKSVVKPSRVLVLPQVYFDPGQDTLSSGSVMVLRDLAKALLEHPELDLVEVQGHRDGREGRPGDPLGLRRARAVAAFLSTQGVAPGRLRVVDHAARRPVDTNRTAAGRAKNRRVAFVVLQVNGKPNP
jgi:OOP family OmpA-OmpF porin